MSINIYFIHDRLTPGNVRATWWAPQVPHVGDSIITEAGYDGAQVEWTVERVQWLGSHAVTCFMTGPTGQPAGAR